MIQLLLAILLLFGGGNLPVGLPSVIQSLAVRGSPSSAGLSASGEPLFQFDGYPDVVWNDRLTDGTLILTHVKGKGVADFKEVVCASPTYDDLALAAGTRVRTLVVAMKNTNGRISTFVLRRSGRAWPVVTAKRFDAALAAAIHYVGRGLVCEARDRAWRSLSAAMGFSYTWSWLK